jgi:DNA polymerase III delta subunit
MARMTALEFLHACARKSPLPSSLLIYGPQAFLREYVLDAALASIASSNRERVRLQLTPAESPATLLNELSELSLFAPARIIVCRVLRGRRARDSSSDESLDTGAKRDGDARLAEAIGKLAPAISLMMLYEHEHAPAAIRQIVEDRGLAVVCGKPFPNQVQQYAQLFARGLELDLSAPACAHLAERYHADLAALYNVLVLAAIELGAKAKVGMKQLSRPFAGGAPELFDLARCVSNAQAGRFLTLLDRASAVGRDAIEVLAVEVIPTLRRMLIAASTLADGYPRAQIARTLGMGPHSPAIESAIDGATRLGLDRIRASYREAVKLDAAFKNGLTREREAALCRLMLDLLQPDTKDSF